MEEKTLLTDVNCGVKDVIQMWQFESLAYSDESPKPAELMCSFIHDYGVTWKLEWCPSCGYQSKEEDDPDNQNSTWCRLGLLAAATSSGYVIIFSMPHLHHLKDQAVSSSEPRNILLDPPVFRARPDILLKPRGVLSMCFTFSWHQSFGSRKIIAAYANGAVAIYDTTTRGPLLSETLDTGQLVISPSQMFSADLGLIRGVSWCPTSEYLFATAGDSRTVKFWDCRQPGAPLSVQSLPKTTDSVATDCRWIPLTMSVAVSQDWCFTAKNSSGLYAVDFGYENTPTTRLVPSLTCVWGTDVSRWTGCLASVDEAGTVGLLPLPNPLKFETRVSRMTSLLYKSCVVSVDGEELMEGVDGKKESMKKNKGQEQDGSREGAGVRGSTALDDGVQGDTNSYSGLISNHYIKFTGCSEMNGKKKAAVPLSCLGRPPAGLFPIQALYTVSWNPNSAAYPWLLSGGQSGIVRVQRVPCLVRPSICQKIELASQDIQNS